MMNDDDRNQNTPNVTSYLIPYIWSTMCSAIKPQDTPYTSSLRNALIGFLLVINSASELISGKQISALVYAVIDLIFLFLFVKIVLVVFRFAERLPQAFNALLAIHIGFAVILMPLHYLGVQYGLLEPQVIDTENTAIRTFLTFVMLAMFIWMLRAMGYVYSQALEIRMVFAIGIAFLYMVSNLLIVANIILYFSHVN